MTNQQLKAHCEDVIANPQDHLDWVVDMARVALASLTAKRHGMIVGDQRVWWERPSYPDRVDFYLVPPAPELKPIELPEIIHVREPGFIGYVYDANEIEEALKRNGIEVTS